jgi:type VI secretion system protein ImpJ
MMKTPQRVVWTEGMFMAPQHMQQLDIYHEGLLDKRLRAVAPYGWGVLESELDLGALAGGRVSVAKFSGVLPDGSYLSFAQGDRQAAPARPIEGLFPPSAREMEIYLAIPREREGLSNYGERSGAAAAAPASTPGGNGKPRSRFTVARRNVADLASAAAELGLDFAEPNVEVLFGPELRDDFEAIKIAEVVRDKAGGLVVNDAYIPPCLRIDAAPFLVASLRRLMVLMVSKQRELSEQRSQRDASSVEFGGGDVTRYLQLSALNQFIPLMKHIAESGTVSPHEAYWAIIQLAGQLTSFSVDADPTQLPAFLFHDLRATFEELVARVTGMLHNLLRARHVVVPLEVKQGVYFGRFEDERVAQCPLFMLAIKTDVPEAQVFEKLPKLSKIASWSQIEHIIRSATPGVPLQPAHRPPQEIPVRAGTVYFSLYLHDAYWQTIAREKTIAIALPPPFDPARTKIELMGVPAAGR